MNILTKGPERGMALNEQLSVRSMVNAIQLFVRGVCEMSLGLAFECRLARKKDLSLVVV